MLIEPAPNARNGPPGLERGARRNRPASNSLPPVGPARATRSSRRNWGRWGTRSARRRSVACSTTWATACRPRRRPRRVDERRREVEAAFHGLPAGLSGAAIDGRLGDEIDRRKRENDALTQAAERVREAAGELAEARALAEATSFAALADHDAPSILTGQLGRCGQTRPPACDRRASHQGPGGTARAQVLAIVRALPRPPRRGRAPHRKRPGPLFTR